MSDTPLRLHLEGKLSTQLTDEVFFVKSTTHPPSKMVPLLAAARARFGSNSPRELFTTKTPLRYLPVKREGLNAKILLDVGYAT